MLHGSVSDGRHESVASYCRSKRRTLRGVRVEPTWEVLLTVLRKSSYRELQRRRRCPARMAGSLQVDVTRLSVAHRVRHTGTLATTQSVTQTGGTLLPAHIVGDSSRRHQSGTDIGDTYTPGFGGRTWSIHDARGQAASASHIPTNRSFGANGFCGLAIVEQPERLVEDRRSRGPLTDQLRLELGYSHATARWMLVLPHKETS